MVDIYNNIKKTAEKKHLSISAVERYANLSRGTVFKWKKSSPTVATLQKVADVLGVPIANLLKDDKDKH